VDGVRREEDELDGRGGCGGDGAGAAHDLPSLLPAIRILFDDSTPDSGRPGACGMKAEIRWIDEVRFEATSGSGHTLTMDGPADSGGQDAGPRPMELVLMGVGGCASYDVVHILRRSREEVTGCVARLEAERAEEPPRVFTRLHLHFIVSGRGLNRTKVGRAVELSAEKYCSASIMLGRGGVAIEHSFEVVDEGGVADENDS
jgi:putative redox protein